MYFNSTIEKYDTVLAKYCAINNVEYLKMFDVLDDSDLCDDGIHPNDNGHEKIYKAIKAKGENKHEWFYKKNWWKAIFWKRKLF